MSISSPSIFKKNQYLKAKQSLYAEDQTKKPDSANRQQSPVIEIRMRSAPLSAMGGVVVSNHTLQVRLP
jgi:hypothetical protein